MTQMDTPQVSLDQTKPVPVWFSIFVILLCLAGGGWMMHWYIKTDALSNETKMLDPKLMPAPAAARRAVGGGAVAVAAEPAIQQQPDDSTSWKVHSPEAFMLIGTNPADNSPVLKSISYVNYEFVPQDVRNMILSARRIIRDDAMAKSLNVTPEQTRQLRGLTAQIGMAAEQADKDQLKQLWTAYQAAADKNAAQRTLLQALTDIAHKSQAATRQAALDRAAKIKAVLTDDQWKQWDAMGK